jgi:TonB family protein
MATRFRSGLMRRSTVLLLPLAGLVPPTTTSAQHAVPDSTVTRLAWGTVNVLVQADTTKGVLVWAETSPIGYNGEQLSFAASFDPQAVDPWLNFAHLVVTSAGVPADSAVALETPPLIARDGSRLVLLRRRRKAKWESHTAILLLDREQRHPWSIDARSDDARRFLEAFFLQAGKSRQRPDSSGVHDANPLEPRACPQPIGGTLVLRYPESLRWRHESGEVWMHFVVQADGAPDSTTFQVLLSDNRAFANAVIQALRRARYHPAEVGGVPVAAHVHQRFIFRMR